MKSIKEIISLKKPKDDVSQRRILFLLKENTSSGIRWAKHGFTENKRYIRIELLCCHLQSNNSKSSVEGQASMTYFLGASINQPTLESLAVIPCNQ